MGEGIWAAVDWVAGFWAASEVAAQAGAAGVDDLASEAERVEPADTVAPVLD